MERLKPAIQWETVAGQPTIIGDTTVIPQSQFLSIRFRFGGYVWNRPAAVLVERNGQTEQIPIIDVTRIALWAIMGFSLALTIIVWLAGRARLIRSYP